MNATSLSVNERRQWGLAGGIALAAHLGLGLLVSVKNTMVKREGTFSMINVKDTVRSIMNQTGLDRYFGI